MLPDDPADLIAGKNYGSEGTAQRYLCALLIDGPEYGYHKSWPLSERGVQFRGSAVLALIRHRTRRRAPVLERDELARCRCRRPQAVDYGFLWPKVTSWSSSRRLGGSHRPGQLARVSAQGSPSQSRAGDRPALPHSADVGRPPRSHAGALPIRAHRWPDVLEIANTVWGGSVDPRRFAASRCFASIWKPRGHWLRVPVPARSTSPRRSGGSRGASRDVETRRRPGNGEVRKAAVGRKR